MSFFVPDVKLKSNLEFFVTYTANNQYGRGVWSHVSLQYSLTTVTETRQINILTIHTKEKKSQNNELRSLIFRGNYIFFTPSYPNTASVFNHLNIKTA